MPHSTTRRTVFAVVAAALLALVGAASSVAIAHATVVFGTLAPAPNPPPADEPFRLELIMVDPTGTPVEDAVVLAELRHPDGGAATEVEFDEFGAGSYRATVAVPRAGDYEVLLRDRTFRQEEARQIVTLEIGGQTPVEPIEFLFPPTATGGGGIATWLIWLIGIPLAAAVVVTVLVLRTAPATDDGHAASAGDARDPGGGTGTEWGRTAPYGREPDRTAPHGVDPDGTEPDGGAATRRRE